ncbi:hypothetical protein BH09BAC5_BH09BAC5_13930 [soil metagenome]
MDWLEGSFHLQFAPALFKVGEKAVAGKAWDAIIADDIPKIKAMQKQLFDDQVDEIVSGWKTECSKRLKNSKLKFDLLIAPLSLLWF